MLKVLKHENTQVWDNIFDTKIKTNHFRKDGNPQAFANISWSYDSMFNNMMFVASILNVNSCVCSWSI